MNENFLLNLVTQKFEEIEISPVIITPDAIRDHIEETIIQDLINQAGIKVVWRKFCLINKEAVKKIYPKLIDCSIFDSIVRNLTLGPSLFILVEGKDVYNRLKKAKGKSNIVNGKLVLSGLRLKYKMYSQRELRLLGYRGKRLMDRIVEFRLHTPDNIKEAVTACLAYLTFEELGELNRYADTLY